MSSGKIAVPAAKPLPTEPKLVTTVDLTNPGTGADPIWQFVYGSQCYQTLFAVYANFRVATSADGKDLELQEVKLKLINYQGILNIGFTDDEPVFKPDKSKFYFGVRGGSDVTDIDYTFTAPFSVTIGSRRPLTFCRMLYPMLPFHYKLGPRTAPADKLQVGIPDSPVFDTEFQHRSGYDYYNRMERPGMYNHNNLDLDAVRAAVPLGSPRCHEGIANLTAK